MLRMDLGQEGAPATSGLLLECNPRDAIERARMYRGQAHWLASTRRARISRARSSAICSTFCTPSPPTSQRSQCQAAIRKPVWVQPKHAAEIEYRAITSDGLLRHGAYKGLAGSKARRMVTSASAS